MGVSKVEYYGDVLIDLTSDTVTPADVMADTTFHSADGEERIGTFSLDDELAEQDSIIEELLGELADKSLSDIAVYEDGNGYVVVEPITGLSGSGGGSGGSDKWELINEAVIEQESASVLFSVDKNNESFSLKKVALIGSRVCPTSGTHTAIDIRITNDGTNPYYGYGTKLCDAWTQGAGASSGTVRYFKEVAEVTTVKEGLYIWSGSVALSTNETSVNGGLVPASSPVLNTSYIGNNNSRLPFSEQASGIASTATKVFFGSYGTCFGVGSEIFLLGVRE